MRIFRNPLVDEGIAVYGSESQVRRAYLYYLLAMAALLAFWWPKSSLLYYLKTGSVPLTFTGVSIGLYACLTYLNGRFGAGSIASERFSRMSDLLSLTPIPVGEIAVGKALVSASHTLLLLVLAAPFLAVALGISGLPLSAALAALLVIYASTLAYRALGLMLLLFLEDRPFLKDFVLLSIIVLYLIITIGLIPAGNPIHALISLDTAGSERYRDIVLFGATRPFYLASVIGHMAAIVVLGVASYGMMKIARIRDGWRGSSTNG